MSTARNYISLFKVVSLPSVDFEDLKKELRAILKENTNAGEMLETIAKRLDPEQNQNLAEWCWNYVEEGSDLEASTIQISLNNVASLEEKNRLKALSWACEKWHKRQNATIETAKIALELVDTLPEAQQHHGAYAVWQMAPEDQALDQTILQKALDTIPMLPEEEQFACAKWVCKKVPKNGKMNDDAFHLAADLLDTIPEAERFEEAEWIYLHARKGSRAKGKVLRKALDNIPALSVHQQSLAVQWIISTAQGKLKTDAKALAEDIGSRESPGEMSFADFQEKLELLES